MAFRKFAAVFLAFVALCGTVRAEDLTPEKRADIEHLLAMTGAISLGKQMSVAVTNSLTQTLKAARPDIPEQALKLLPAEVAAVFDENIDSLKNEIIPIYHAHFTAAEIKGMISFYSSDLGQKTIRVMPILMQEGMAAGQRWGNALGPVIHRRIAAKLKQQGIDI